MQVCVLALGSRGDVQPFIALGRGLAAAGHQVRIAATADYGPLVGAYGFDFVPLVGAIAELADPERIQQTVRGSVAGLARYFFGEIVPLAERLLLACWHASADADLLLTSTLGMYPGWHIATARHLPWVTVHFHPYAPLDDHAHPEWPSLPPWLPGRRWYNRTSYWATDQLFWQLLRGAFNRARRSLGLAALGRLRLLHTARAEATLLAYSAQIAPSTARAAPICGYWRLDAPSMWQPPQQLQSFLQAGPPPVLISFGSMMFGARGADLTQMVLTALRACGQRGLIFTGWGDLGTQALPPEVLTIEAVPHDWLLPQVAAVVHHGGAGITAATLRAGVPALAVPVVGDQPFWGARLAALGAGVAPIPLPQLTAQRLTSALRELLERAELRTAAQNLGAALMAERGVEYAVHWLESYYAERITM